MENHINIEANSDANRYLELIQAFPIRPIRDDAGLEKAIAVVDSLIDRDELDPDERDYLDVLADQIEKFEAEQFPVPAVSEADMLRHLIEAKGVSQGKVAAETGIAESTISAILTGKRALSKNHVAALSTYFKVSPAVFIGA